MEELADSGMIQTILGVGGIGGILWALYERFNRMNLDKAQAQSGTAEANANRTLFNMLTKRLNSLEAEVDRLRRGLTREREYTQLLISTMVQARLNPPPYPVEEERPDTPDSDDDDKGGHWK